MSGYVSGHSPQPSPPRFPCEAARVENAHVALTRFGAVDRNKWASPVGQHEGRERESVTITVPSSSGAVTVVPATAAHRSEVAAAVELHEGSRPAF